MKSPSSLSSFASEETRLPAPRVQRATEEILQRKMMCWLVSQGSAAMNDALRNNNKLPSRTDLGEQPVRIAEVRAMTSAAYASGKPARLKFWYGKFRRMHSKGGMRNKVDEHLDECSDHKNYKIQREAIDSLRAESVESETYSPFRKNVKVKVETLKNVTSQLKTSSFVLKHNEPSSSLKVKVEAPENVNSESVSSDEFGEPLRRMLRVRNSGSKSNLSAFRKQFRGMPSTKNAELESEPSAPGKKLGRILYSKSSGSVSNHRTPLKKPEEIRRTKSIEYGLDESPVKKRRKINISESESSESDENPLSIEEYRQRSLSTEIKTDFKENLKFVLDESPLKKREVTLHTINPESGLDESPVKKRGRIYISQSEPSKSHENSPSAE